MKIHTLHHAAHGEIYGLALIKKLERHGYPVSPGTMYPVLHDMERVGYLSRTETSEGGRANVRLHH
jgi:DNA-binding PadR family transcriptional regulator